MIESKSAPTGAVVRPGPGGRGVSAVTSLSVEPAIFAPSAPNQILDSTPPRGFAAQEREIPTLSNPRRDS